jgi:hypothetical protein
VTGDERHLARVDAKGHIGKGLVIALVPFAHQLETDHRVTRWPVKLQRIRDVVLILRWQAAPRANRR